jgi:hypothetical protein
VKSTLRDLCGSAVELAAQGEGSYGGQRPNRYRPSEAARAWVAEGERCG